MDLLAQRIAFKPLGANLNDGPSKSFVMPDPKLLIRRADNFASMAHVLAAKLFLDPEGSEVSGQFSIAPSQFLLD